MEGKHTQGHMGSTSQIRDSETFNAFKQPYQIRYRITGVKRGRGRPGKQPDASPVGKRGRGRPKKIPSGNDVQSNQFSGNLENSALVKINAPETPSDAVVKRGRGRPKGSTGKYNNNNPTDAELSSAIRNVLFEVDFQTATVSDVRFHLERKFNQDFSNRKTPLKALIQMELTKIAEELEDVEDEISD